MPTAPRASATDRGAGQRLLVAPAPGVRDPVARQQMRVLAGISLPLMVFALIELIAAPPSGRLVALFALTTLGIGYAASRTTWTTGPVWILTLATTWIPYFGLITPGASTSPLSEHSWAMLLPLVASLAMTPGRVLMLGTAHIAVLSSLTLLNPQIPLVPALQFMGSIGLVTAITVVAAAIREEHEAEIRVQTRELAETTDDLARAKALSENTIASMADGLLVADGGRRIRTVNPALAESLGYEPADLLGLPLEMVLVDDHDDTRLFEAPLKRRDPTGAVGVVFRTRAGDHVEMSCRVTQLKGPRDLDFGLVIVVRDLRETIAMIEAAALAEAHARKAREIQDAHDQLLATQAQLVQAGKLAALGELAGAVAHEVNNPLGAALLASDLAQEALLAIPSDLATADKQLRTIQEAIKRCRRIIDGLLDFARQSSGGSERVDLAVVVQSTLQLVGRKLAVGGTRVEVDLPQTLPVFGDRNQLGQVVLNLVMNASQAIQHDGTVRISGEVAHGECALLVADDGQGMPPAVAERIFEPFFTTKPRGQGTGLGLSISYGIITEHGGRITVESAPGRGSTFRVQLPHADEVRPS